MGPLYWAKIQKLKCTDSRTSLEGFRARKIHYFAYEFKNEIPGEDLKPPGTFNPPPPPQMVIPVTHMPILQNEELQSKNVDKLE